MFSESRPLGADRLRTSDFFPGGGESFPPPPSACSIWGLSGTSDI